jgi:hypothetical protein
MFYFRMGLCFFPKRTFDTHFFSFFRASNYSILSSKIGATLLVVHLFRKNKNNKCCFISFFHSECYPFKWWYI